VKELTRPQDRILFIAPQPFYEDRGTPIAVRRVLEVLSAAGEAVDLITYPVGEPVSLPGVRIFRVGTSLPIRRVSVGLSARKLLLDGLMLPAIASRLRHEKYGCIHAVEEAAFPAAVMAQHYGLPLLYDMASSLPEQLGRHRLLGSGIAQNALRSCERWLLRRAELVVCSAGLKPYVESVDAGIAVREWVFPGEAQCVDRESVRRLRLELAIPEGAPVVVYTGTFAQYQGLPLLIEAAAQVHERLPEAVFVLVGASGEQDLAEFKDMRWLRIVRRRPRTEMAMYLAMADVLASPRAYGDNLPMKVFDYLAAGRPIVASDCPTHRTVLDDSRARLVQSTPEAMAASIIDLLLDPDKASSIAQAARHYAESRFGPTAFAEFVKDMYAVVRAGRFSPTAAGGTLPANHGK